MSELSLGLIQMKIVAISDTHNRHKQIKDFHTEYSQGEEKIPLGGDIIIHAGDATGRGERGEVEAFLKWYGELDFSHRIFVPGNHDFLFEKADHRAREMCKQYGITLLIDESVVIDGVKIHGSPYTPWFYDWAFNRARHLNEAQFRQIKEIKPHWDLIPDDTNVLITHGPPYGILDELLFVDGTPKGQFVGCEELLKRIKQVKPDLHFFGHIHCGHGQKHIDGTSFYNVAVCDEMYCPTNPVTIVEYEKD